MRRLLATVTLLAAAAAAHASITATVLDDDGKPLAGARLRAYGREDATSFRRRLLSKEPETSPIATAASAEDGSVSIDVKGTPVVRLVVDAPGRSAQVFDLADGDDAGAVVLAAAKPPKGHITSGGKPVANALVALGQWYVTHTDASGGYEIPPMAAGSEHLVIIHPDYAIADSSAGSVEALSRHNLLDVSLVKGQTLKGHVYGSDGKTPAAHVVLSVAGWPLAESDESGAYTISHAPQNWRAVFARSAQLVGVATKRDAAAADIKLTPAARAFGIVKGKNGPVAGVYVSLYNEIDASAPPSAVSDAKGRFSLDGVLAGHYSLFGSHPSYGITRLPVDVPSAGEHVLTATDLVRLRGTVVDEAKKPVAGARVTVMTVLNGGQTQAPAVISSVNGQFSVRLAEGGSVQFIAAHRGYAAGILGPLAPEKAKDVTIVLPAGFPMSFRIVDAQRQPVTGATVEIRRPGDGQQQRSPLPCSEAKEDCRITKADGTLVERIVEGKYDLSVTGDEIAMKRLSGQTLTARSSPLTITVDRGVVVSGRVTLGDGTPVSGAIVSARSSTSRNATSGTDGTFSLKGLAAGPVTISASTPNTNPPANSMPLAVTAPAKNVLVKMPTPSTLSGRVMEKTSGQAVTDFQVVTSAGDAGNNRPSPPSQIHSDDGTFSVPVIPGRTELRVTAAGFVRATLSGLTVEEGKPLSGIEVRMDRGGRVVGRVTSGGAPVSQAYVTAFADRYTGAQPGATTDVNGEYVIDGVDAGQRTVEARKTGLLPKNKQVVTKAGEDVRADLELDKGREVRGRVLDRSGHPIESARIMITGIEDRSMHANSTTDVDGNFNASGLGDGHLMLRAEHEGYVAGALDDVDPAQNVLITLDRGGSISGRVVGLSDAETGMVSVTASYGGASARATVDTDGSFTVNGVPDGSVSLSAMKAGAQMRHSAPKAVTVTNGSAPFVEIDFAEGISVRGRVTREGAPVSGGGINFMGLNGAQNGNSQLAPDGTYQVNGLQTGDYRIFVSLYGTSGLSSSEKLTVTGSMTHDIDLTGTSLRGRVLDAQAHTPLSDVTVQLKAVSGDMPAVRQVVTDSDGRFIVELLKEGSYHLNATRSQYAARQQDVTVPGPEVEISLDPATPTIVRVVDSISGAGLAADVVAAAEATKTTMGSGRAMSDGTIQLWLPDGSYKLHATAPGYMPATVDLVVPSSDVRITLQRGGTITFRLRGSETNYRVRLMANGVLQHADYINVAYRTSLPGITPGTYVVEVTSVDGKTPHGTYPVTVLAGQTTFVDVVN